MNDETLVYDRSRVVIDWKCPRAFFLEYKVDGKGIVPATTPLELYLGTTIHDGLAVIASNHPAVDIDNIGNISRQQIIEALSPEGGEIEDLTFAKEQAALVEGLLRGFYRYMWPRLMSQFPKIVAIEQEVTYEHNGLTFMARPDLIVEDLEGRLWYLEYKSTSSKKDQWINSWQTAIQLHSSCKAVEATLGRKVTGVVVQGLYKGYESYGKQSSPFCYCYRKEGNPPFTSDQIQYEYKAGFKRFPVWELEGGVKRWVEEMPEAILCDQFPQTPPIFINDRLVDRFFKQQEMRQAEIDMGIKMLEVAESEETKQGIMDCVFEQHWDQCSPAWGKSCPYRRVCHGEVTNPLEEGFQYREPHHALEVELFEGGENE